MTGIFYVHFCAFCFWQASRYLRLMDFTPVEVYTNYIDAHIKMGRLQDAGINCWLKDENLVTINPIWTQAAGGIKLMVANDQLEETVRLLEQFNEEKRKQFICPDCKSGNIEYVSSHREAGNWLSVFFGFLILSFAMPIKTWRCFSCHAEFKEPEEKTDP